jgi:hypothetical protein
MAPPNIRPLTIEELNALHLRVINNEGFPNVLSEIEYHSNEFVQPRAQEYIRRIREYIDRGAPADLFPIRTALRFLIRTKINPMEALMPVENILPPVARVPPPPRHGGRRRKHRKTRSKTRKARSRR